MKGGSNTNQSQSDEDPLDESSRHSSEGTTEEGSVQSAPTVNANDPPEAAQSSALPQRPRSARLQASMARIQQAQAAELQEARSDRSVSNLDYQHLSSAYGRLAEETTRTIRGLRDRIRQLEQICGIQNEELQSLRSSQGSSRRITQADIKNSDLFKSLKADALAKAREATTRALEARKERNDRQLAKVSDALRDAKHEAKDAAKSLSSYKKEFAQQKKNADALQSQSFRIRDMLSRTRVDLASCIKSKKALQDDLKVMTKTLARTEKDRATVQRELEKAKNSQEVRKAEAAEASLKKEQVILEREKLRCENRIRSKVVEMELDRHKKESLLVTQADLKNALEVSKDDRAKGKRDRRVTSSTDRIWSSIRAVEMANRTNLGGQFPLMNSPEATQIPHVTHIPPQAQSIPQGQALQAQPIPQGQALSYAPGTVPHYAPPPAAQVAPQAVTPQMAYGFATPPPHQAAPATPNQDVAQIVATVLTAMNGRGTEYREDPLPEGVTMVQDQPTGRIYYRTPPGPDGRSQYFQNRDEIFRKPTADPERRRLFGTNLANSVNPTMLYPDERRVRQRMSPPDVPTVAVPTVTVPAVPAADSVARLTENASDSDARLLATQPLDPADADDNDNNQTNTGNDTNTQ